MSNRLDPRRHAFRDDLADVRLKGRVEAARFVEGAARQVLAYAAPLRRTPAPDAPLDTEVLRGETFTVFDTTPEGWSWGQLATDGYVGYVPTDALGAGAEPTHRVAQLRTFVYPGPDMKLPALGWISFGGHVALGRAAETRGTRYGEIAGGEGWIGSAALEEIAAPPQGDFVAVAERFVGTPYLWGGRTSLGLDCSALVQLSLAAAGVSAPRDTEMQAAELGEAADANSPERRGDIVFWDGHVAIMIDGEYMVHASGHHLAVVIEAFSKARDRILAAGSGAPTMIRRLP